MSAYDEYIIETTELTLYLSNIRIDVARLGEDANATLPFYSYRSLLRTNQPGLRVRTARQTLIALSKRNCDPPRNALPTDMSQTITETFDRFKK